MAFGSREASDCRTDVRAWCECGVGGPATSAGVYFPQGIALDGAGNLYIASDFGRIRKVLAGTGIITTVAGNGDGALGATGDGGLAINAEINPMSVATDAAGSLYFADGVSAVH